MKKYFSFLLSLSLFLTLAVGSPLVTNNANAATTNCVDATGIDFATNTPCSLVVIPCPVSRINPITKKPCNPAQSGNTSVSAIDKIGVLKKGAKGENVKTLQKYLAALGVSTESSIDGVLGSQTQAKIKILQKRLGLNADGVVGAKTLDAIKKAVAKDAKAIALLKKFNVAPDTTGTSGTGSTGGSSGSGSGSTGGSVATSCPATSNTPGTRSYKAVVNADNYFKVFIWNKNTKVISGAVMQDLGGYGKGPTIPFSEDVGVDMPEAGNFNLSPGDQIVIVQLVDSDLSRNAVMAQFSFESNGQKAFYTNAGNWQVALSKADAPSSLNGFTTSFVKNELSSSPSWTNPYELSNNSGEPFSSGIDIPAKWISAFSNGTAGNNKKVAIYMTKESGIDAAPSCGTLLGNGCTFPYAGTGSIVNNQIDCKLPPPSSANLNPGAHVCGPSNLTDVTVKCTGVYPNLTIEGEVVFSPGAAQIVPDGGVEIGLSGVPEIRLKSVGGSYGTHLKFSWSGVATSPLSKINGATLLPLSMGSYFGFPGGFYRNGLTAFPLNTQAFAAISAIAAKVECTPPPITPTIKKSCVGSYPSYVLNATATFPEAVTITGNPTLVSSPTGMVLNLSASQPSDNKLKTWSYVPPTPPEFSNMGPYLEPVHLVLGANDSIKYTASGANVNIADVAINDVNPTGCAYTPPVDTLTGSCVASEIWPNITYTLNVKFNKNVFVTGVPQLKIQGATNGLVLDYVLGSGSNTLTFKYITDLANPDAHVYNDTVGDGKVKFVLNGGAEIKDENNISLNGLVSDPFAFNIPSTISCPKPISKVQTVKQECRGLYPTFVDRFYVNFDEKVNITGVPSIKVDKPNGIVANFSVLSSDKKKATFLYQGLVLDSHDYDDFNGDVKFNPLGTAKITSENGSPADISGTFSFDPATNEICPVPHPDTLPEIASMVKTFEGDSLKVKVTFSNPVVVQGNANTIQLKPTPDNGKRFKLVYGDTTSTTVTLKYEMATSTDPGFSSVSFVPLAGTAVIKGSTNARVPNLYSEFPW